jgi:protein involved in polysaccharide export with SLBB domain
MQIRSLYFIWCLLVAAISSPAWANTQLVQAGDQIKIELPGEPLFKEFFSVDKNGFIVLPEVGKINVLGLYESELSVFVASKLKTVFRDVDDVMVYIAEKRIR